MTRWMKLREDEEAEMDKIIYLHVTSYIISRCQKEVKNTRILLVHVFLMKLKIFLLYHSLR